MIFFMFSFLFFVVTLSWTLIQLPYCPVGWGCRIHRLHLCRGLRPPNECPRYATKQSDGEVQVMLELWEIRAPLHCHRSQVHFGSE